MRLKELREERNLTQSDVAVAVGTSQRNISRWENESNEPTASFLIMLANYFQCSIDFLLERSDDFGNITIHTEKPAPLPYEYIIALRELFVNDSAPIPPFST